MTAFSDLVHVERIAEALWRKSPLGNAALMVGAGMSRNARNVADPGRSMPTWDELAKKLCDSLYPTSDKSCSRQREHALKKSAATSGALRLAQEFEASFGRTELNRLLKSYVPDEEFAPSELHIDFLKLPWADVFTTNWDTLLERAIEAVVDRRYDVVRTRNDIPASQQPRIVKLHGSFPANDPFIFTEEDYRCYPKQFAYFVNMVQQSMMENLFCMVGFSGDDPNFLHWAGWVRDNLGELAPKIYLVGWLDLAPVQRRMLEDRNVVPVDLSRLPQGSIWPEECRHRYALEWFFWMLKLKRLRTNNFLPVWLRDEPNPPGYLQINPALYAPKKDNFRQPKVVGPGQEAERLADIRENLPDWQEERKSYKGWIVAPAHIRNKYWGHVSNWAGYVAKVVHLMPPWERIFVLREIAWQRDICLAPLDNDMAQTFIQAIDDIDPNNQKCFEKGQEITWTDQSNLKQDWPKARNSWFEVAIDLLRYYRMEGLSDQFKLLASRIEKLRGCMHPLDALTYQRVLFSIQHIDYATAKTMLQDWHIDNSDHIWAVRKAGLLFELGESREFDAAYNLLTTTLTAIRRSIRRDSDDYSSLSREGCAMYLLEIAYFVKNEFKISRVKSDDIDKETIVSNSFDKNYDSVAYKTNNNNLPTSDNEKKDAFNPNDHSWDERSKALLIHQCDVRDEWQTLCALLDASPPDPRNTREVKEKGFDLGQYFTNRHFGSGEKYLPAYQALAFTEATGMAKRISPGVSLGAEGLSKAAIWLKVIEPEFAIRLLLGICTAESDKTLKVVASREIVAQLNKNAAERFIGVLIQGIEKFGSNISLDKTHLENLRVAMELLSRVSVRLTDYQAQKKVFNLAITLTQNRAVSGHPWLSSVNFNLLYRSIKNISASEQVELLLPLLSLPTEGIDERSFGYEQWWSTFYQMEISAILANRQNNPREWNETIRRLLIEAVNSEGRKRAIWRLTFLHSKEVLSDDEQRSFANALWSADFPSSTGLPGMIDLNPWVFLDLPALEDNLAERLIRKTYLIMDEAEKISLSDYFRGFGGVINIARQRKHPFTLSTEEESVAKSMVVKWANQQHKSSSHPFARLHGRRDETPTIIGVAELLPFLALSPEDLGLIKSRIEALEKDGIPCYDLYPPLMQQQPDFSINLINQLKIGVANDDSNIASRAVHALSYWLSLAETGHAAPPPDQLLEEIGLAVYLRREPVLATALQFSIQLFEKQPDLAKRTIASRVLIGLEYLFEPTRYEQAIFSGLVERIDVPLIRYNCTNISIILAKIGYSDEEAVKLWLESAPNDPLPEVRNQIVA